MLKKELPSLKSMESYEIENHMVIGSYPTEEETEIKCSLCEESLGYSIYDPDIDYICEECKDL